MGKYEITVRAGKYVFRVILFSLDIDFFEGVGMEEVLVFPQDLNAASFELALLDFVAQRVFFAPVDHLNMVAEEKLARHSFRQRLALRSINALWAKLLRKWEIGKCLPRPSF